MRMGERRIISDQSAVGPESPSVGSGSPPWLRWSQGLFGGLALLVLCLTVYVPGIFSIPPIDRDECRFAQASRQMFEAAALPPETLSPALHDGGWAIPKVQDRPRLNKPPLIYWLQVASAWAFAAGDPLRDHIWMYRLPSVLCATIAVLLTWRLGVSMIDPRAAWLAAALLAICPVVVFDAHQARADQLLLATVVATQFFLWRVWRCVARASADADASPRARVLDALGFWICLSLSILAKGPIGPMIAALTVLALGLATRRWAWIGALRPFTLGPIVVAACAMPWLWMVGERVGWSNYAAMVFGETLGRTITSNEGHWGPPGMHTVLLAVLFWPGSLMTALAIKNALARAMRPRIGRDGLNKPHVEQPAPPSGRFTRLRLWWTRRGVADGPHHGRAAAELFLLAWILPSWLVFELVGAKLLHYTMPMYPAIALLTARWTLSMSPARAARELKAIDRFGFSACVSIGVVAAVAILGITLFLLVQAFDPVVNYSFRLTPLHATLGIAASLAALAWLGSAASMLRRGEFRRSLLPASCAAVTLWIAFFLVPAPFILPGSGTREITAALDRVGIGDRELATEYHEDSIVFATRGRALRLNSEEIERWLHEGTRRVAVRRYDGQGYFPSTGTHTDLNGGRIIVGVPWRGNWLIVQGPTERDARHSSDTLGPSPPQESPR